MNEKVVRWCSGRMPRRAQHAAPWRAGGVRLEGEMGEEGCRGGTVGGEAADGLKSGKWGRRGRVAG